MKLSVISACLLAAIVATLISPSIGQTKPQILTRPRNVTAAKAPEVDKKSSTLAATKVGISEAMKLKLFTGANLTPASPAIDLAGLYMEQVAQFDANKNTATFYGSSGNLSTRFYPSMFEKSYLVEFTITNSADRPVEFILDFGPGLGSELSDGFTSALNQKQTIPPGKHKIGMVVSPKNSRWYWVQIRRTTDRDLWTFHSAAVTYMK